MEGPPPGDAPLSSTWILLARSGDDETLGSLASCAASAAASGIRVRIVWEGAALRRLVDDGLEPHEAERERLRREGRLPASEILALGGEGIESFACSAAAVRAGGVEAALAKVQEVVGWSTVVGWISRAERVLSF